MKLTASKKAIWHYIKITLLVFGISGLWQCMHSLILPMVVLDFASETQKNTWLGLMTFSGLIIAMLAQPVAGAISDRSNLGWGRRKPFIIAGVAGLLAFMPVIGVATSFTVLFIGYCALQFFSNAAQGPYQAFIPEMVPANERGKASGVKSFLEILGGAALLFPISRFMDSYSLTGEDKWLWFSILLLGGIILVLMLYTVIAVKEPRPQKIPTNNVIPAWIKSFNINIKANRAFLWFLASRLAVFMGLTTIQQFALYYFRDVVGVSDPAAATTRFLAIAIVFMLLAVFPAGYLSDYIGRKKICMLAALTGAAGILIILTNSSDIVLMIGAAVIGLALGAFNSTNWALATDLVNKGEEAKYLGIANMATAGGGALARLIGPVIDFFNGIGLNLGYTVMLLACIAYFIAGALLLIKVRTGSESKA
ncbi:MAG: MFS transporter [Dehalococcoidales bacterium]|jgi:Na+/melibiose symporter-like transporter|nr:MFS transporter [Dehalococcoidales bacterium]MDD4465247.1 MFS transporter [Dehalococcoidales bacterium]MDD5401654.1 MFS transporter [Dehalococcoidales bacterium]